MDSIISLLVLFPLVLLIVLLIWTILLSLFYRDIKKIFKRTMEKNRAALENIKSLIAQKIMLIETLRHDGEQIADDLENNNQKHRFFDEWIQKFRSFNKELVRKRGELETLFDFVEMTTNILMIAQIEGAQLKASLTSANTLGDILKATEESIGNSIYVARLATMRCSDRIKDKAQKYLIEYKEDAENFLSCCESYNSK